MSYPKRLIEVDLPIKRISAHARREKSIRHGHICTLHIWWARRPLAACRAVLCAALWPDPADENCPPRFRETAARLMQEFAFTAVKERSVADLCDPITWGLLAALRQPDGQLDPSDPNHLSVLRTLLLQFIADFANWDASTEPHYLATARALTQAAHEALGGAPGTRPLVVDPFAGGGAIPLEALRVGADAFASDLNPVAVLLNKVVLEYIPKYGQRLASEVRKWGEWVKKEAEKELAEFYPQDPNGATPIGYLWARTIRCEGPGCGAEVPIIKNLVISSSRDGGTALELAVDKRVTPPRIVTTVVTGDRAQAISGGTSRRSSVTCPNCGYTTPRTRVEAQANQSGFGFRMLAVCLRYSDGRRLYRQPQDSDLMTVQKAETHKDELVRRLSDLPNGAVPTEELPYLRSIFTVRVYGIDTWAGLFHRRQLTSSLAFLCAVRQLASELDSRIADAGLRTAILECVALSVSNSFQYQCNIATYLTEGVKSAFIQGQSLPMKMDFIEANPLMDDLAGGYSYSLAQHIRALEYLASFTYSPGTAHQESATSLSLPDDSSSLVVTDPPYYDVVPYADCSDFFFVWLKRMLFDQDALFNSTGLTPKEGEVVQLAERNQRYRHKTKQWFENKMCESLADSRRITLSGGLGVIVFAHKETRAWEALLASVLDGGWVVTASWPIHTEKTTRLRAHASATLSSSIHLVCRPRENPDGSLRTDAVGEWRDVLGELPGRIHEWMPRLAREGVVGADAIFACLGPALEIYSRYSRVERADGTAVPLGDVVDDRGRVVERGYLSYVWEAVSKEALSMIFEGADATGFEEDARLSAIWFWTLKTADNGNGNGKAASVGKSKASPGFALEYDAARKLAQGLGVDLARVSQPGGIVVIKGNVATLNRVMVRERYLMGTQLSLFGDTTSIPTRRRRRDPTATMKAVEQRRMHLIDPDPSPEYDPDKPYLSGLEPPEDARTLMQRLYENGSTRLDRLHQAMLLHARGQTALLRPFLQETGAGQDARFWTLANVLSALYPANTDEKRWVDGVLARKKGLGF